MLLHFLTDLDNIMDSPNEDNASDYCDVIALLYSNSVQVAMSWDGALIGELYKEERELIKHAGSKRQSDFAAGRLCAKRALLRLGVEDFPVLMDRKGAPIWPLGVSGSISHARGCCAAVVARGEEGESLGLDIEEVNRINESIWEYAFGLDEITWIKKQSISAQKWASVIFAAKEAFYKAQYPLTQSWLGFKDVVILVDQTSGEFTVRLLVELGKWLKGSLFVGKYSFFNDYVVAGLWIDAS